MNKGSPKTNANDEKRNMVAQRTRPPPKKNEKESNTCTVENRNRHGGCPWNAAAETQTWHRCAQNDQGAQSEKNYPAGYLIAAKGYASKSIVEFAAKNGMQSVIPF